MTEDNEVIGNAVNRAINEAVAAGSSIVSLQMSEQAWTAFKSAVPRNQRRQRQGTRFVTAYRAVPISIHPTWEGGWRLETLEPLTAYRNHQVEL